MVEVAWYVVDKGQVYRVKLVDLGLVVNPSLLYRPEDNICSVSLPGRLSSTS